MNKIDFLVYGVVFVISVIYLFFSMKYATKKFIKDLSGRTLDEYKNEVRNSINELDKEV